MSDYDRERARKLHKKLRDNRNILPTKTVYIMAWLGTDGNYYYNNCTDAIDAPALSTLQEYHKQKRKKEWEDNSWIFIIDKTKYVMDCGENYIQAASIMNVYHRAKENGTIRIYRLD